MAKIDRASAFAPSDTFVFHASDDHVRASGDKARHGGQDYNSGTVGELDFGVLQHEHEPLYAEAAEDTVVLTHEPLHVDMAEVIRASLYDLWD